MQRVLWLAFVGLATASSPLSAQGPKLGTALGYFKRGYAYGEKGGYDKAIADYTDAIRLDPNLARQSSTG